jgi:RNA polymerase sigma-70 factor (ECF subfamily)
MAALGKLLEEHRPRLVAMVRRRMDPRLAQRVDAEEIVSEAYLTARTRHAELKDDASVTAYAWLYRIVRDCLIEAWRRETRDKRDLHRDQPFAAESSAQLALSLMQTGTSPSHALARKEMVERMQKTLELLSERDREVLSMRHYDQLSHREAADVLGISETAATVRYVRALERLRKLWEHLYGDLEMP